MNGKDWLNNNKNIIYESFKLEEFPNFSEVDWFVNIQIAKYTTRKDLLILDFWAEWLTHTNEPWAKTKDTKYYRLWKLTTVFTKKWIKGGGESEIII